jgi:glycine cleavage system aminomethyltransferase T
VRLRTPALLAPGERLHTLTGDPAGQVTSAVVSPTRGPLALAVVRRAFSRAGTAFAGGAVVD